MKHKRETIARSAGARRRGWPVVRLFSGTIAEIADTESSTQDRLLYVLVLGGLVLASLAALLPPSSSS